MRRDILFLKDIIKAMNKIFLSQSSINRWLGFFFIYSIIN